MRIVAFEVGAQERAPLTALARDHELRLLDGPLDPAAARENADAEVVSTFVRSRLDADVLAQLPALRMVATRSTGFDHVDLDACEARGIVVSNVPAYGAVPVAEHTFGLLLTLSHRLHEAMERARAGGFVARDLTGFDLRGKTLGVVGTGAIGRGVIRIAQGFGMRVLAHDIAPDEDAARTMGFDYVALGELLARSDIVTLHVPATPATRHLIGREAFGRMKEGAVLLNTARGDVVDVHALVDALRQGRLRAAGLDVLPEEATLRERSTLLSAAADARRAPPALLADLVLLRAFPNVVVTPHSAYNTQEAVEVILTTTVENVQAFAAGVPRNVVGAPPRSRGDARPPPA